MKSVGDKIKAERGNWKFSGEAAKNFDKHVKKSVPLYSTRQDLINKLYNNLNWGGALVLFEKVRGPDARFQDIASNLYIDYKLRLNYTPDDIISKSLSLKGILEPFSTKGNIDLLKRAGFKDINTIQKYICFEGFLAIK